MLYPSKFPATTESLATYCVPTLEELREHVTTEAGHIPSGAGARWAPIHHLDLIESILSQARRIGLEPTQQTYGTSEDLHSLYGSIDFAPSRSSGLPDIGGLGRSIGFRSDNLQRFKLLGVSGARVFVCSNGVINGDFVFGHKHTNRVELATTIQEGLEKWRGQQLELGAMVAGLRARELSDDQAKVALVNGCRREVFAWSQAGKVDAEWREPRHEEFRPRNAWSLYNAVTEVAKAWSPRNVEKGLRDFPALLLN